MLTFKQTVRLRGFRKSFRESLQMKRQDGQKAASIGREYSRELALLLELYDETDLSSVWRPLVDVVETDPLVCCDTRTVADSDLDVVQKVMDNTVEESMYLKRRTQHQWYWMSNQTRDDVLVMTVWDSKMPSTKSSKLV
jgi:hypothetical protein